MYHISPSPKSKFEASISVSLGHKSKPTLYTFSYPALPLKLYPVSLGPAFHIEDTTAPRQHDILPTIPYLHASEQVIEPGGGPGPHSMPHLPSRIEPRSPSDSQTTGQLPRPPSPPNNGEECIDLLEEQQEELRDARDDLVGSRFRLNTKRREFRNLQEKADTQAGVAFDLIRQHIYSQGISLPANIENAFSEAAAMRESLAEKGADLETAEETYNLEEWRYTQKETKFIEGLSGSLSISHAPALPMPLLETRNLDPGSWTQFSFGPPGAWDLPISPEELEASLAPPDTKQGVDDLDHFSQITIPELQEPPNSPNLSPSLLHHATSTQIKDHIATPPLFYSENYYSENYYSESAVNHTRVNWSTTLTRIDTWMLDILSKSHLQQGLLKTFAPMDDLDDEAWWQLVIANWSPDNDNPYTAVFHTGDTTVSSTTVSHPLLATTTHGLVESPDSESFEMQLTPVTPLLSGGHIFDELETFNIPAFIKPSDLADDPSTQVGFMERSLSTRSVSTAMTSLSSVTGVSRIAAREAYSSCTSSEDSGTVTREGPLERATQETIAEQSEQESPSPSIRGEIGPEHAHFSPVIDGEFQNRDQGQRPTSPDFPPLAASARSNSPESDRDRRTISIKQVYQIDPTAQYTRSPSPPRTTPSSTKTQAASRPSEPYIRIDSPEPWSLPLLRLTPLLDVSYYDDPQRLENLPFVTLQDSPYRLPGPSKSLEFLSNRT